MRESYPVEMDARGHIVIPSAVRKARGFGAHTLFVLFPDGDELRLIPGEVRPKREIRMYSNEEIAQALIELWEPIVVRDNLGEEHQLSGRRAVPP